MSQPIPAPNLTAAAQDLHSALEAADLNIVRARTQFEREIEDDIQDVAAGNNPLKEHDPAIVASDVVAHLVRWSDSPAMSHNSGHTVIPSQIEISIS
jgi:hypothetical protein